MPSKPSSSPPQPQVAAPEARWTAQEDARLVDLRNKAGLFWVKIAEELGTGRTGPEIKARYAVVMQNSLRGRKVKAGKRSCLSCGEAFFSPNLTHFKCCDGCRNRNSTVPEQYALVTGSDGTLSPGCSTKRARSSAP